MNNKGYVRLYRGILDNLFLMNDNNAFNVFVKLWALANRAGEYAAGTRQMSETFNINRSTLRHALERLEAEKMITTHSNKRYTIYKITNWYKYQHKKDPEMTQETLFKEQQDLQMATRLETRTLTDEKDMSETRFEANARPMRDHSNKNKKENINTTNVVLADEPPERETYGKNDINEVFAFWEQTTGIPIQGRIQQNRYACHNLLRKYKMDGVQKLVRMASEAQSVQYAPSIHDFVALQGDINKLLVWAKNRVTSGGIAVIR